MQGRCGGWPIIRAERHRTRAGSGLKSKAPIAALCCDEIYPMKLPSPLSHWIGTMLTTWGKVFFFKPSDVHFFSKLGIPRIEDRLELL